MTDRIGLVNRALTGLGNLPLQGEDAFGADHVLLVFDGVVDAILTAKRWRFNRKTISLVRNTAAPESYWDYSYALPGDRMGLPETVWKDVTRRDRFTDFEYSEGALVTNAETIWVRYAWRPPYNDWPFEVIECLVLAAQAEFAMAVNEDAKLRAALRVDVWGHPHRPGQTGMLQQAATHEGQSEPGPTLFDGAGRGPFIDVRGD